MKDSTLAGLATAAAAITTIALFFRRVVGVAFRAFISPVQWFREQAAAARKIDVLAQKVDRVHAEVTPNGGGSMKDALLRIDKRFAELEESLDADGQQLQALLTDSADGTFKLDAMGGLRWANRTLCKMLGRQSDELIGRGWEQAVIPEERDAVIKEWDRCVAAGRELWMNIHFQHADGKRVYLQVHSYPIRSRTPGKLTGYFAYCRAIPADMEHK